MKNQGTQAAKATWYDSIYLSTDDTYDPLDRFVSSSDAGDVSPFAAGATYSRDATITLPSSPAGSYYLLFVTDAFSSQSETNENNNVRALPITLEAADTSSPADLEISDVSAPDAAAPGQDFSVSWVVTNVGTADADASWIDAVYLSTDATLDTAADTPLGTISIDSQSPLPDGRGYIVSMDVFLPGSTVPCDYHLFFVTNSAEDQAESTRENNAFDLAFTVEGTIVPAPRVSSSVVNDGEAQRSMVTHLTLTFNGVVTIDGDAFRLERDDGLLVGVTASSQVLGD